MSQDTRLFAMTYAAARVAINTGDLIAFGGRGLFSSVIRAFTDSPVSHVGIAHSDGKRVWIIESTTLAGSKGVQVHPLSKRVEQYNGEVWWLPLSVRSRNRLLADAMVDYLCSRDGHTYDRRSVLRIALRRIPALRGLLTSDGNPNGDFCSELATSGYQIGGIMPATVEASDVEPAELVRWRLFSNWYYQLKGVALEIPGYNSEDLPWDKTHSATAVPVR